MAFAEATTDKKKLWSALASMATAASAFKKPLDQHPKDTHVVDLMKLKPEEAMLKMGDSISLFSIEANGYLISEGYVYVFVNTAQAGLTSCNIQKVY
jgi:hypothetical protein